MNGQLNSLESFDSGSNYHFGDKMIKTGSPRSLFDLSHLNTLTIKNCGVMVPIALWECLPGDDHDINVDCLLRVMPQVVPLYSRQRLYVYGFYSRYSDLWNNWQVFMDKGYTGNVNKLIPQLNKPDGGNLYYANKSDTIPVDSLFDYMGLPIGSSCEKLFGYTANDKTAGISALPFMMYLRIYRDYFMNKNHWINDRVMLPDDDSRFRLDDDGCLLSAKDENKVFTFDVNSSTYDLSIDGSGNYHFSGCMHDYPDDYFISALPFTQRGIPDPLQYKIDLSNVSIVPTSSTKPGSMYDSAGSAWYTTMNGVTKLNGANTVEPFALMTTDTSKKTAFDSNFNALISSYALSGDSIGLQIFKEDIVKLALQQQELEQLARTDGSYKQFGLSFFGESSKAAYDFRPIYIGGTYKNIAFTEVLQTATTQTTVGGNTVDNLTGSMYGHGITGITNGRIGHIHCDDYGMIMLIACIMPDVYYSQGLDKIFTESVQSEKWLPERVLLGMQPIYNKELYYAGNNGNSQGDDNYLWAYQNPFDHLRYIPNHIHGKIADSSNKSFYPFTQARHFTQLPNWGRDFSSTNDVRKDYLVAKTEDAYSAQFSINVRSVRPLPYKAIPAKLVHF